MTEPLSPDEVSDLISGDVARWPEERLEAVDRLELQVAACLQSMRILGESLDRVKENIVSLSKVIPLPPH